MKNLITKCLSLVLLSTILLTTSSCNIDEYKQKIQKVIKTEQKDNLDIPVETENVETTTDVEIISDSIAINFLTQFYSTYKNGGSIINMLSKDLRNALNTISQYETKTGDLVLDYDPFCCCQDIGGDLSKGIFEIKKVNDFFNIWQVSYNDASGESRLIVLQLKIEDGNPKVNDVRIYEDIDNVKTIITTAKELSREITTNNTSENSLITY